MLKGFVDQFLLVNKIKTKTECLPNDIIDYDLLKVCNLFFSLTAEKIIRRDVEFHDANIRMSLNDGLLLIHSSRMSYTASEISFEASLTGDIGVAIENGKIKREMEMLSADALDTLASLAKSNSYQDLNSMTLRFLFEKRVGNSEIMFMDTPNVMSQGAEKIDLKGETLDLVIQPKPKKGIPWINSAIRIKGPLCDPKPIIIPFKEAPGYMVRSLHLMYSCLPESWDTCGI